MRWDEMGCDHGHHTRAQPLMGWAAGMYSAMQSHVDVSFPIIYQNSGTYRQHRSLSLTGDEQVTEQMIGII